LSVRGAGRRGSGRVGIGIIKRTIKSNERKTTRANLSENDSNIKLTGREDVFSSSSTPVGVKANSHHVAMLKFFSGTLGPSLGLIESDLLTVRDHRRAITLTLYTPATYRQKTSLNLRIPLEAPGASPEKLLLSRECDLVSWCHWHEQPRGTRDRQPSRYDV